MSDDEDDYSSYDDGPLHDGCHVCGTCENWCSECKADNPQSNLLGYTVSLNLNVGHVAAVWDVADASVSLRAMCGSDVVPVVVGVENYDVDGQWGWEWRDAMSDLKDNYASARTGAEALDALKVIQQSDVEQKVRVCPVCADRVRHDVKPVQR